MSLSVSLEDSAYNRGVRDGGESPFVIVLINTNLSCRTNSILRNCIRSGTEIRPRRIW